MSTPIQIVDGAGTTQTAHLHKKNGDIGIISYVHPLREGTSYFNSAFNSDYGTEMALDGGFSGTPEKIHDGTDNIYWAGSNVVGTKATFDSILRPNSGTKSVLVDNPNINDVWQFAKGSSISPSGYTALTMFVNVDKDWTTGDSISIYGWDTGLASSVGTSVLMEDYFNQTNFDTWQKIVIPLSSMGLGSGVTNTIDALRFQVLGKDGKAPRMFLDDIQMEQTGDPVTFYIKPPKDTRYTINVVSYTFIDAYVSTLASATMPNLSYNKILDEAQLSNGINFQLIKDGSAVFSSLVRDISDSVKSGASVTNVMSDGTNSSVTLRTEFIEPIILDSKDNDNISITISDDLTGLISFTAIAMGKLETLA